MKKNKDLSVIIVAAGSGSRFKNSTPKSLVKINGKPILWYSLYSFQNCSFVKDIFVVIAEKDLHHAEKIKKKYFKKISKFNSFIIGGNERHNSVYNALLELSKKDSPEFIAVHDAARPFIKTGLIELIFDNALKYNASAPALPVVDTIKISDKDNFIIDHPKRDILKAIQTPQIFNFKRLFDSYKKIISEKNKFTDDAEVYGKFFKNIKLVSGDEDLFKITYPKDLDIAKTTIKKYKIIWK